MARQGEASEFGACVLGCACWTDGLCTCVRASWPRADRTTTPLKSQFRMARQRSTPTASWPSGRCWGGGAAPRRRRACWSTGRAAGGISRGGCVALRCVWRLTLCIDNPPKSAHWLVASNVPLPPHTHTHLGPAVHHGFHPRIHLPVLAVQHPNVAPAGTKGSKEGRRRAVTVWSITKAAFGAPPLTSRSPHETAPHHRKWASSRASRATSSTRSCVGRSWRPPWGPLSPRTTCPRRCRMAPPSSCSRPRRRRARGWGSDSID